MSKEKNKDPLQIAKDLFKKYGEHLVKTGSEIIAKPMKLVSVSPIIDINIGGGIPEGSVVLLAGDEKCGKTVTALQICRNAQQQDRNIHYLNIEHRLKKRDLEGISGLNSEAIHIYGSFKEDDEDGNVVASKLLTGEEWLSIAEHCLHNDPGCIVVIDSISQLVTEKEINANIGDVVGDGAYRLMSQFIKRMAPVLSVNDCILIGIQHMIANTRARPGQKSKGRSGGRKIRYAVDVDLECRYISPWTVGGDDDAEQIGQDIHWITRSTAILPPGRRFTSKLRYGIGLDDLAELFELGKALGFIAGKGWYTLDYMRNHEDVLGIKWEEKQDKKTKEFKPTPEVSKLVKAQGQEKILSLLKENPKYIECLKTDIYDMLGC